VVRATIASKAARKVVSWKPRRFAQQLRRDSAEAAMAKLLLSMFISLDGYIEGPGGQFIGPAWSDDLDRYWSLDNLDRTARILYGRVNFEFNRGFWTDLSGPAGAIAYAGKMNSLPKTVVSTTLTGDPGWNGAVVSGDLAAALAKVKAETTGGDLVCFGGAGLANSLMRLDLVDEYKLMVVPTLFGGGRRLFEDGRPMEDLRLIESRTLDTGAVILRYEKAG
jgi:dihydrofolate reductase